MRYATLLLLAALVLDSGPALGARAAATDIIVQAGMSVQAAIDAAPAGATITLPAGTFTESITITKPLTLQGAGWEKTTIGPDRPTPLTQKQKDDFFAALNAAKDQQERVRIAVTLATQSAPPALTVKNAKGVVLQGLRFHGPPTNSDGNRIGSESLITFDTASGTIRDCAVVGPYMNGVTILTGSEVKIEKSLVAAVWGTGVSAHPGTKLHISDSDIRNCYHRCVTFGTDDATIERCRISGSAWHGIRYDNCSPTILSNHIFGNARSGIYASGRTAATVRGNVFWRNEMNAMSCWFNNADNVEGNTIIGNLREGIIVLGGSRTHLVRNVFVDNPIGVACGRIGSSGQGAESPSGDPKITGNFFFENPTDVQASNGSAKPLPPDNRIADPKVSDAQDNFRLAADSPAREANAGAADPIALASPFTIQAGEISMIPDSDSRDFSLWKKDAAASRKVEQPPARSR
jgi:hypothetical protein